MPETVAEFYRNWNLGNINLQPKIYKTLTAFTNLRLYPSFFRLVIITFISRPEEAWMKSLRIPLGLVTIPTWPITFLVGLKNTKISPFLTLLMGISLPKSLNWEELRGT